MSMATALSLSLNNLMTKKGRTVLTAFAGAIGIIGIALILSLSNGIQTYINQVQEDTLSSYPIEIEAETVDMTTLMTSMMGAKQNQSEDRDTDGRVYSNTVMYDMMNSLNTTTTQTNDLKAFKTYLAQDDNPLVPYTSAIQYSYDLSMDIYAQDPNGVIIQSDVMTMLQNALAGIYGEGANQLSSTVMNNMMGFSSMSLWEELLPGEDGQPISTLVQEQYDLVYGSWPQAYDEVVLAVTEHNEIPDLMLFALGLKDQESMLELTEASLSQQIVEAEADQFWTYEELCQKTFKMLLPSQCYEYDAQTGTYVDLRSTEAGLEYLYRSENVGTTLKIVGIIRPNADATATMLTGSVGYTSLLTSYVLESLEDQPVLAAQLADPETDVISGLPFPTQDDEEPTDEEKQAAIQEHISQQDTATKAAMYLDAASQPSEEFLSETVQTQMANVTREDIETQVTAQYAAEMGVDEKTVQDYIAQMTDEDLFSAMEQAVRQSAAEQYTQSVQAQLGGLSTEQLAAQLDQATLTTEQYVYLYDNYMPPTVSDSTYEDNLTLLGYVDKDTPSSIRIYAATFADKDAIADVIADYNNTVDEEQQITYTDYVALLMSSVTSIINAISYVLIAFVAISLIVSSIMIAIITYISVLERTKEIGILRSVGASKGDISRVFNAETLIEGFVSGAMGIGVSLLLLLPINAIVRSLTNIQNLRAILPWQAAAILVVISMILTFVAGLVPSRMAAKKDPVEALRSDT